MAAPQPGRAERCKTPGHIQHVGSSTKRRKMVCKRNQCVDRGGGSPMTRTLTAGTVMSACDHTPSGGSTPALVWPVSRGSYASHGSAYVRRASCPPAVGSGRLRPARPPLIPQRAGVPRPCQPMPEDRLYLYLYQWHAATLFGCSFDPGRDVLCLLTSPRWLHWP